MWWRAVGAYILKGLGFLGKNPGKTAIGAGLVDHFAFDGAGRGAAADMVLPDWMQDPGLLWEKFQEFLSQANLGGGVGAGVGFLMSGDGLLNKAICTIGAGLIGNFLYGRYLQNEFNLSSGADQSPEATAEPGASPGGLDELTAEPN